MKYNCYFCKFLLTGVTYYLRCDNCPHTVLYYRDAKNTIYIAEIIYQKYIVTIYLEPLLDGTDKFYLHYKSNIKKILSLAEDPGITPYNIKEKLPLLLTFR
jgi:hypothetical protein